MNLSQSIKKALFPTLKIAYVGIAAEGGKAHLITRVLKNRKVIKEEKREFELPGGHPTSQMLDYLYRTNRQYTYTYTATLLSSINQGAVPSCDESFFHKLGIDTHNIVTVTKENRWSIYASELDIEEIQGRYEPIDGLDFIFPSEALIDFLHHKSTLRRNHEKDEAFLYLLYEKSAATLVIYVGEILTYSSHFVFDEEEEELIEDESDDVSDLLESDGLDEGDIQEEIVELDTIGDQDDLGGIEDLDDFIAGDDTFSLDDFEQSSEEAGPQEGEVDDGDLADDSFFEEDSESNLKRDMLLFNFIKNSVHDFYHNEHFESSFITHAEIYDTHGGGRGLGRFLKEELYIETATHELNLSEAICDLAISEAGE
jgi:hypothetical protein